MNVPTISLPLNSSDDLNWHIVAPESLEDSSWVLYMFGPDGCEPLMLQVDVEVIPQFVSMLREMANQIEFIIAEWP